MSRWNSLNPNRREMMQRTLDVSGEGAELLQTYINRTIQQLTVRHMGLSAVLPRKQGVGDKEYINVRSPLGLPSGTSTNDGAVWVDDLTEPAIATGAYEQKSFEYKTLVTRGRVTRVLQARGKNYADILAAELQAKAEDFNQVLEDGFINGDSARTNYSNSCLGYLTLISDVLGVNATQMINCNGGSAVPTTLSLAKLDEAIDAVKGSANRSDLIICGSRAGLRELNKLLQADQQFNDVVEVAAGFRVRTYDGIPLITSTEMMDTIAINAGGALSAYTGGTSTSLLILNKRYAYISELTPTTVMPLSKTTSQFDQFDMFWDGAPVLSNGLGGSLLVNFGIS